LSGEDLVPQSTFCREFSNGLVLVAEPMRWLESAAMTLMVPAGCVYDPVDRGGLSGFVSEMSMRGAAARDSRRIIEDLDNLGVERSEAVFDSHIRFSAATLAGNLSATLAIYADISRSAHLPADQLEAGRQVMFQELRAVEDEPAQKVMIELSRRYYPEPWGRPSQGEQQALENTTLADVTAFYARHFHPNGAILGIAGNFDWPAIEDRVGELWGDWQPAPQPEIVAAPESVARDHLPYQSNQTQIGIAYPAVPYRDPDYFQAWGAVGVLSGGMSARLFTEVRERRGLCYSVYATYHTLRDRAGVFCYAGTSADRAQETLDVTLHELTRLARGVEPDELKRLKARIKSGLIMQQESSSARSASVARDWYHLGRVRSLEEVSRLVDALSCESINAHLVRFPPRSFTIVTLGPRPLEVLHGDS
jgi:predicted Zn-dependent peptidase